MFKFTIFALFALAAARPDIGLQLQQQSLSPPQGGNNQGASDSGIESRSAASFGSGNSGSGNNGNGNNGNGNNGNGEVTRGTSQVIDISGSSFGSNNIVYKPVVKEGPPKITKHFYIHEAPEETVATEEREREIEARPHKHYKIIFIKTPSAAASASGGNAAVFPQNEEKTIVYVLSEKADGVSENGEYPTPAPPVYAQPEVFFVKYKTQQEAEKAISAVQTAFNEGGSILENPAQFASNLGARSDVSEDESAAQAEVAYTAVKADESAAPEGASDTASIEPQEIALVDNENGQNLNFYRF